MIIDVYLIRSVVDRSYSAVCFDHLVSLIAHDGTCGRCAEQGGCGARVVCCVIDVLFVVVNHDV